VQCATQCTSLSAVPFCLDLKGYAGDVLAIRFRFVHHEDQSPYPVPGDWLAQIRRSARDPAVLDTWNVDDSDEDNGVIGMWLNGAQTAALPPDVLLAWDLQRTAADSTPRTYYRGDLIVTRDVTR
jgi:hypothetical protein